MVSLEQVHSSNARIASSLPDGLVAVFLGGTGAVGQATLKQFTKLTVRPRIYFLGRSQSSGDRITAELKALNPEGDYCFIRADVSLLAYTRLAHEGGFDLGRYAALRRWIGEVEAFLGLPPAR